jgi:hypothetical protein
MLIHNECRCWPTFLTFIIIIRQFAFFRWSILVELQPLVLKFFALFSSEMNEPTCCLWNTFIEGGRNSFENLPLNRRQRRRPVVVLAHKIKPVRSRIVFHDSGCFGFPVPNVDKHLIILFYFFAFAFPFLLLSRFTLFFFFTSPSTTHKKECRMIWFFSEKNRILSNSTTQMIVKKINSFDIFRYFFFNEHSHSLDFLFTGNKHTGIFFQCSSVENLFFYSFQLEFLFWISTIIEVTLKKSIGSLGQCM